MLFAPALLISTPASAANLCRVFKLKEGINKTPESCSPGPRECWTASALLGKWNKKGVLGSFFFVIYTEKITFYIFKARTQRSWTRFLPVQSALDALKNSVKDSFWKPLVVPVFWLFGHRTEHNRLSQAGTNLAGVVAGSSGWLASFRLRKQPVPSEFRPLVPAIEVQASVFFFGKFVNQFWKVKGTRK